jgi:hypothetical protein
MKHSNLFGVQFTLTLIHNKVSLAVKHFKSSFFFEREGPTRVSHPKNKEVVCPL